MLKKEKNLNWIIYFHGFLSLNVLEVVRCFRVRKICQEDLFIYIYIYISYSIATPKQDIGNLFLFWVIYWYLFILFFFLLSSMLTLILKYRHSLLAVSLQYALSYCNDSYDFSWNHDLKRILLFKINLNCQVSQRVSVSKKMIKAGVKGGCWMMIYFLGFLWNNQVPLLPGQKHCSDIRKFKCAINSFCWFRAVQTILSSPYLMFWWKRHLSCAMGIKL